MGEFTFLPLSFCLEAKENMKLSPFKAAMLRGSLGLDICLRESAARTRGKLVGNAS